MDQWLECAKKEMSSQVDFFVDTLASFMKQIVPCWSAVKLSTLQILILSCFQLCYMCITILLLCYPHNNFAFTCLI